MTVDILKPSTQPDTLQVVQDLKDKLESYRLNFNKAQSRLDIALKEIERLNDTNRELLGVVTLRNRAIKRKDDQLRRKDDTIRDLRYNKI